MPSRLSESILWDIQKDLYTSSGINCWINKGVPFYITNNSLIAQQYAKIVASLFNNEPMTLLELGAGCGKFAYLFLLELEALGVPLSSIRYLITDFSEKNVLFYRTHPLFASWIERGILVPNTFDPVKKEEIEGSFQVIIANYFFDAIAVDLFRLDRGVLLEGWIDVKVDSMEEMQYDISYFPGAADPFTHSYAHTLSDGSFLFPTSGVKVLDHLLSSMATPFFLLTADRGVCKREDVTQQEAPSFKVHGSFSFPVNYHALAAWFRSHGGSSCFKQVDDPNFIVGLLSSTTIPPRLKTLFYEQKIGPLPINGVSLSQCCDHVEQANQDATLFFFYLDRMKEGFHQGSKEERARFLHLISQIEKKFYPLSPEEGCLLGQLGLYLIEEGLIEQGINLIERGKRLETINRSIDSDRLQIGQSLTGQLPNCQTIAMSIEALKPLGKFDLILFFALHQKNNRSKSSFIQAIEAQFPHIHTLVYSDEDLEKFFIGLDRNDCQNTHLVTFFRSLFEQHQISQQQFDQAMSRAEKEGLIEQKPLISQETIDYFPILLRALNAHLKEEGVIKAYFPSSFSDERFFNEIVINPYIDYSEQFTLLPSGQEVLELTIKKVS